LAASGRSQLPSLLSWAACPNHDAAPETLGWIDPLALFDVPTMMWQIAVICICGLEKCFSFHDTPTPFSVILATWPKFSVEQLWLIIIRGALLLRSV